MKPMDPGRPNVLTGAVVDSTISCCCVVSTFRWAAEHRQAGNNECAVRNVALERWMQEIGRMMIKLTVE